MVLQKTGDHHHAIMQSVDRQQRAIEREHRAAQLAQVAEAAARHAADMPGDIGAQDAAEHAHAAAQEARNEIRPPRIIENEQEFHDPMENLADRLAQAAVNGPPPNGLKSIDIPKPTSFDGALQPSIPLDQFLHSTEAYLRIGNIKNPDLQVYVAGGLLTGVAQKWYQAAMQSPDPAENLNDMNDFKRSIRENFAPSDPSLDARNMMADCVQTSTVREYLSRFRCLALQIAGYAPGEKLDKFRRGLKMPIRKELIIREVKTFTDAVRIAEAVESTTNMAGGERTQYAGGQLRNTQGGPSRGAPATIRSNYVAGQPKGRLTAEERTDLMRRGACFYCREEGHMIINCPKKAARELEAAARAEGNEEGQ